MFFKSYIETLVGLLTDPTTYLYELRKPLRRTLLFFVMTAVLIGISSGARFYLRTLPVWQSQVESTVTQAISQYPSNLRLQWNGQHLESSQAFNLPYPSFINTQKLELPATFVSVETTEVDQATLENRAQLAIVTPEKFFIQNRGGQWAEFKLQEVLGSDSWALSPDTAPQVLQTWGTAFQALLTTVGQLLAVLYPVLTIGSLLWGSLVTAFLFYFFSRIDNVGLSFKHAFQFSALVTLVAAGITEVTRWLYPQLEVPMFTICFWAIFLYVYFSLRKRIRA